MKALVFGKDGQLGKAFQEVFSSHQPLNEIHVEFLGRAECDLCNPEAITTVLKAANPNLIINASAYTAVDKAEAEADLAYAINARAPELMAAYAAKHGATFLHYSTDYVFDGEKYGFYLEDDQRNPLGVYGKSKAAGEEGIARIFANSKQGQYAILRTSWVYGDGGNFIRTILRLAQDRDELKVIADQYGVPTSAQWLAQVSLELALTSDGSLRTFPSGTYHAVPAGETSWHGLATLAVTTALEAGVDLKTQPQFIKPIPATEYPLPAPRPTNSRMSTDKLQSVLAVSRSYNDPKQSLEFPHWEGMVQDYVRKLASSGVI